MNNGAHAASGMATGAATVAACDLATALPAPAYAVGALFGAGMALAPDIDHDASTFTTSGGKVTRTIAEALQTCSRATYGILRKRHDHHDNSGEHRGLTHTWPFAALVGVLVGIAAAWSPWVGAGMLWLALAPAIRALAWSTPNTVILAARNTARATVGRPQRKYCDRVWLRSRPGAFTAAGVLTVATVASGALAAFAGHLGLVATVGMLAHDVGDGFTPQGVPWKFPFPHRCGKCRYYGRQRACSRWNRSRNLPRVLVFPAGHEVERFIAAGCLVTTGVVMTMGAYL